MIKAVNRISIQKGRVQEVAERFSKAKSVHTFEGFVLMEVLIKEGTEEEDVIEVCTTWEDHESFNAWRESRATQKSHGSGDSGKKPEDNPILGAELSTYEVFVQHHPETK
ncbi:antibiotic biosynthesis monooxygenase [Salinicoccus sp. ID82-1]|uniref:antibiotic biosynthesis monooxygenase n=1 Tax=Salinicoccus sp. ID82-1 TaxID=2820269 RepID=UPI001F2A66E5|nr:antibiotic biosynthesis monooxygenase [Salinicoccus sp. ID82-1]MCG1010525.1 antibiotic biosynthesis monooxygenase [Salinicoccus sp. ID82-1]